MERKRGVQIKEGDRINRWTVIKEVESESGSSNFEDKRFLCRCDCGTERVLRYKSLAHKTSKSCGCYMREFNSNNRRKFPQDTVKSRIYTIWNGIKCRCYTKSSMSYKRYGAKGITMCDEWRGDFMTFYNWSIANGYADSLTIDRIDSKGNYEPSNCRWVDDYTQANNTSRNYLTELGTIGELSRKYNINYGTLTNRVKRAKMNISEAVSIGKKYHYKPVVQYDIAGNYITEYPSIKDAANAFCRDGHVFGARRYITECCKHQRASYRGSKFEFKKLTKEIEL